MKETREDYKPRRDGLFEHDAHWREVKVGTIIADKTTRTKAWELIDTAHGATAIPESSTLWLRFREISSGEEITVPPRSHDCTCVVLTHSPLDTEAQGTINWPSDSDAVMALVEGLGATLLASRDETTGKIYCPDYVYDSHLAEDEIRRFSRGIIEHMAFGHGLMIGEEHDYATLLTEHGIAHKRAEARPGGFPHIHLPEVDINKDFVRERRAKGIVP